jgi:hypothetical protein
MQKRVPASPIRRQRFVLSCVVAPKPFHRDHEWLGIFFNNWESIGGIHGGQRQAVKRHRDRRRQSGRQASRNSLIGPDYASTDLRLTRRLRLGDRVKVELMAESFNLLNRDNKRVQITQEATRPSSSKPLTPLESIFFRLNTACPLASYALPTPMLPGRYSWP